MGTKRRRPIPSNWTFGYLHPNGECPHDPLCFPDGTRCKAQPKQALAHASSAEILFYGGAVGGGKALDEDTPIPTPTGFVRMADLRVGDEVLDEGGVPCRVTWKSDPHIDRTGTYLLTFDDGSVIVAGGEHRWWTFTADEREQARRRSEAFKAKRRASRPMRGAGKRPDLARRNQQPRATLDAPSGQIRTSFEIAASVESSNGKNHSIPLAGAWELPSRELLIDPYVLGVWLGDGTSANGGLTSDDPEIMDAVRSAGYVVRTLAPAQHYYISGLQTQLRALGVLKNKHVPEAYLWSSADQRLALLQGLMDTDGCANADGQAEFTSTKRVLADAVFHLAVSLACKPTLTEGAATLYGRVIGPKWTVKWTAVVPVFRLARKLARVPKTVRPTQTCRYVVACERVPDVTVQCLSVDSASHLYLAGPTGIPTHNSEYDLVEAIAICLENPGVKVGIFRRKLKELKEELVGRFLLLCPDFIAKYNGSDMFARFFNGSELWFGHVQHEKDVYSYQGIQFVAIFFDEASQATEFIIRYLITRVRSARLGMRKRIRLTSNPGGPGHGYLKRWFLRPTAEELGDRPRPEPFEIWRPLPLKGDPTPPEHVPTRQFVPAWFKDNLALALADPYYLARVYQLGGDKARQLAEGDWDANDSMIVGPWWRERHVVQATDAKILAAFPGIEPGQLVPWHVHPDRTWRPPLGSLIYGSTDYGYGAPWAFHLHATLPGGHTRTFFEDYGPQKTDQMQAQIIKRALERETFADGKTPLLAGLQWIVYDPIIKGSRAEMGLAKSILEVYQDAMPRVSFLAGVATRHSRLSRPNRWMDALSTAPDGLPWWSCTSRCEHLIRTVPDVPWDEDDPDVEDDDAETHCFEDVGRFFEARPHGPRAAPQDPFAHLADDPVSKAHQEAMRKKYDDRGPKPFDITGLVR